MKRKTRILAFVLVAALIMLCLSGCGRKGIDAEAAVDAYLKAETRGEFEEYAKMAGVDKEELEKNYTDTLEEMKMMFKHVESLGIDVGDELVEEIRNLLATAKYEITGSVRDDDGNYTVDVDVYPSDVITLFFEKIMEGAMAATEVEQLGDVMVQGLRDAIAEQSYGEPETCQVRITYNKENKRYEISDEDTNELVGKFFDFQDAIGMDLSQLYAPSGTVYDDPYLNWTYADWTAAAEEEKTQCCLAILKEMQGLTDEQMAMFDLNDPSLQEAVQAMKDGIELGYSGGLNISIGDYVEIIKSQMGY